MNGKDLSRQLSDLPEDMIAEAMEPADYLQKKRLPHRLLRIAAAVAAVAILVTAAIGLWPRDENYVTRSGVLRVYACEAEEIEATPLEEFELTDTVESYKRTLVPYTSAMSEPLPFLFQLPDDYYGAKEITFAVSVDYGVLYVDGELCESLTQHVVVKNGERIRWTAGSLTEAKERFGKKGKFYASIIIYADGNIVGYGMINFVHIIPESEVYMGVELLPSFVTTGCTTVCFPLVDGKFQNVSKEYIEELMDQYRTENANRLWNN